MESDNNIAIKEKNKWFMIKTHDRKTLIVFGKSKDYPIGGSIYQSRSTMHDSFEELIEKRQIHNLPCKHCGQLFETCYRYPTNIELKKNNICLSCNHWVEIIDRDKKHIIVNGKMYADGGRLVVGDNRIFKGHGGRLFTIDFFDGSKLETNNLWCQGDVPSWWRVMLPDNAVFRK